MTTLTWAEPLKVGRSDRYSVDITSWLDGQSIASATITASIGYVTIGSVAIDGNIISATFAGVSLGVEVFDVAYETATRTGCIKAQLLVEAC